MYRHFRGSRLERRITTVDRRTQTFTSIIFGARHPRRHTNRRPADDQVFVLDWHDSGLFYVAIGIVLMSTMDAAFTLKLLAMGGEELNLAMKALLNLDTRSFLAVKFITTGIGVVFLVAYARVRLAGFLRVRRILQGICGIYAVLMIYEVYLLVAHVTELIV